MNTEVSNTEKQMTAHEIRDFANSIYDGGYRADDIEDIIFEFGVSREDAEKTCEILKELDCYEAEEGDEFVFGDNHVYIEETLDREGYRYEAYLDCGENNDDLFLMEYEQRSMKEEDFEDALKQKLIEIGKIKEAF